MVPTLDITNTDSVNETMIHLFRLIPQYCQYIAKYQQPASPDGIYSANGYYVRQMATYRYDKKEFDRLLDITQFREKIGLKEDQSLDTIIHGSSNTFLKAPRSSQEAFLLEDKGVAYPIRCFSLKCVYFSTMSYYGDPKDNYLMVSLNIGYSDDLFQSFPSEDLYLPKHQLTVNMVLEDHFNVSDPFINCFDDKILDRKLHDMTTGNIENIIGTGVEEGMDEWCTRLIHLIAHRNGYSTTNT